MLDVEYHPKADVYNYGKVLFEIIFGKRSGMPNDEFDNYFPTQVIIALKKGEDLLTLLDYKLEGSTNMEQLIRACKVYCWCIQDDLGDRPTMGQVVNMFEGNI